MPPRLFTKDESSPQVQLGQWRGDFGMCVLFLCIRDVPQQNNKASLKQTFHVVLASLYWQQVSMTHVCHDHCLGEQTPMISVWSVQHSLTQQRRHEKGLCSRNGGGCEACLLE